jgi:site-specific recombinase XerD
VNPPKPLTPIQDHLQYLERVRHYAQATMLLHRRVCALWETWIVQTRKRRDVLQALPDDLLAWVQYRRAGGLVQDTSIVKELCVLRTLYKFLEDFHHLRFNPAASLPELICRPPQEQQYLTVPECFQLLDSYDQTDRIGLRNYMMTAVLWSTGLRRGELCRLLWKDIVLDEARLLVRHGKGGKQRQLFLNDRLVQDLRRYRARGGAAAENPESPLFPAESVNRSGTPRHRAISPHRLVQILQAQGKIAGISKSIGPLTLRHTFATHMFEAGVSIHDLKEMLGHTDEMETTVYVHVTLDAARRLLNEHISHPFFRGGDT